MRWADDRLSGTVVRLWRRTQQMGWLVNGVHVSNREAAKTFGLYPVDRPLPYRARVKRWWYEVRDYWARRIAP